MPINKELKEGQCSECGGSCSTFVQEKIGGGTDKFWYCNNCGWFALRESTIPKVKKVGNTTIDEDLMNALID